MNSVEVKSELVHRAAGSVARIVGDGTFDDPENARIIYLAAGGLVLLAVLLGLGTWYWWRTSKVEHPALGPLEVMGTRGWRRADYNTRARELEAARPANAVHEAEPAGDDDELDLAAIGTAEPVAFDDFSDLLPAEATAEPVAIAAAVSGDEAAVVDGDDAMDAPAVDAGPVAEEPVEEPVAEEPGAEEPPAEDAPAEDAPAADEAVEAPAVAGAEPAVEADPSPSRGVIVIDTSPSKPVAEQLTLDEAAAEETEDEDDGDGEHFDPLLRLNTAD